MRIPSKICVGYQERPDTYSSRLGYVVYFDEKGRLTSQRSFNDWRSSEIEPDTFDNVPLEGFVLHANAGGIYQGRVAKIRVHDPRGFEVEIGVENLLEILKEGSCSRRVLDGEFFYGWEGRFLTLIQKNSIAHIQAEQWGRSLKNPPLSVAEIANLEKGTSLLYKKKFQAVFMGIIPFRFSYTAIFPSKWPILAFKNRGINFTECLPGDVRLSCEPSFLAEAEKELSKTTHSQPIVKFLIRRRGPYATPLRCSLHPGVSQGYPLRLAYKGHEIGIAEPPKLFAVAFFENGRDMTFRSEDTATVLSSGLPIDFDTIISRQFDELIAAEPLRTLSD